MKKERIAAIFLALTLLFSLTACAGQTQTEEESTPTLRAVVCAPLATLDPAMYTSAGESSVLSTLFEGLMRVRGGKTEPGMAKDYEVEKNYDDTVTYTFRLRSSAYWSDGKKVTAHDFVYAWRRLVDPETNSPNAQLLSMLAGFDEAREEGDMSLLGVKAEDASTLVVTLSSPCSYFLDSVCTDPAAAPLREELVEGNESFALDARTVINGPLTATSWAKDKVLTAEKNKEYYESRVLTLERIDFLFAENEEQAQKLYDNGEADYLAMMSSKALAELAAADEAALQPLAATVCALYNNATDTFADPMVRKAFDMVLDRAAIAETVGATAVAATGLVPYGITDYVSESGDFRICGGDLYAVYGEDYAERCTAARRQLAAAGNYNGAGISMLKCIYVGGEMSSALLSKLLAMWRQELNVSITASACTQEEFDAAVEAGEFDIALSTLYSKSDDPMGFLDRWHSERANNTVRYMNSTYDLLIGVAESAADVTARTAFMHDAESMLLEDAALSPLYFKKTAVGMRGWTGIYMDALGHSHFLSAQPEQNAG